MSIISRAREKLNAEEAERNKSVKEKISEENEIRKEINERFLGQVWDSPIAVELLCEYFSLVSEWDNVDYKSVSKKLFEQSSGTRFYRDNLGDLGYPLMQKVATVFKPLLSFKNIIEMHAWAVKFANVYGIDIYFVPFKEPARGFAITVFDPRDNKHFFRRDIPADLAVDWVAEYLSKK